MRRSNFFVTAAVAIITFATLSAFVHRPWGAHRGWRHGHCHYDDRYYNHERDNAIKDSVNSNH